MLVVVIARMLILPPDVSIHVALAIALSMVLSLIFAKMVGGLLPLIAELLHQDPAAMAAPLITTIVDTFDQDGTLMYSTEELIMSKEVFVLAYKTYIEGEKS